MHHKGRYDALIAVFTSRNSGLVTTSAEPVEDADREGREHDVCERVSQEPVVSGQEPVTTDSGTGNRPLFTVH